MRLQMHGVQHERLQTYYDYCVQMEPSYEWRGRACCGTGSVKSYKWHMRDLRIPVCDESSRIVFLIWMQKVRVQAAIKALKIRFFASH